jgi:hypothetical protein
MLPHHGVHTDLWTLAHASYLIISNPETPKALRRGVVKLVRQLKKKLPPEAMIEVLAAEAEAAIKATDYLRRDLPRSSSRSVPDS